MWRLIWFLQGYVQAELRGASPEWALERLSNARVAFCVCSESMILRLRF